MEDRFPAIRGRIADYGCKGRSANPPHREMSELHAVR
jgi:hypothetical protein